jgi:hypothetical protein
MNKKESETTALAVSEEYALVPQNPRVQIVAKHLRWKAETAISRIKRALPAPLEQQIYLAIMPQAGESTILPESLAKILHKYLGDQQLQLKDLMPDTPGNSRLNAFLEFLAECMNLLKVVTKEYAAFSMTIEDACLIALTYGGADPERLIEMVDCNLEEMCDVAGISNEAPYSLRMRTCVWLLVEKIIPDLLDITDFLNMSSERRHQFRRLLSQQDELSMDLGDDIRAYDELQFLKKKGLI